MRATLRRRRALAALLGSVVLHAALFAWLWRVAERPRPQATHAEDSIDLTIEERPPVSVIVKPQPVVAPAKTPVSAKRRPSNPAPSKPAAPQVAREDPDAIVLPPESRIRAGDVPTRLDLTLHGGLDLAPSGGETIRNLPGEEPAPLRHPDLQARVDGWIAEHDSASRVEDGRVDGWFVSLGRSLELGLAKNPPPNPGVLNFAADTEHAPPIWAIVDLEYASDGKVRESKVLSSSGDGAFNAHVLKVVALGLPGLADLPDSGFGIHPNGTHSVWEVRGHVTFESDAKNLKLKDDWWYLPLAAISSVATSPKFDEVSGSVGYIDLRHPHLKCDAKLLRVY